MISLEAVFNNLDEAVFLFDKRGRLVFTNKAGEEFLGRSFREMRHRQFKSLFPEAKDVSMLIHKTINEGRSFNCKEMDVNIGRAVNVDLNLSPFYPDVGGDLSQDFFEKNGTVMTRSSEACSASSMVNGAILCMRENLALTEREDYQFDSLLFLLGSISHEIKNPLSGIKGAAQLLKGRSGGSEADEFVNLIIKESDRLNAVLQSYLTMTRRPVLHELNIHEVIEHGLKVMGTTIKGKKVTIEKSYDPSLPNILGDEGKLLQVFINLFKNALEALETAKERRFSVSTRPSNEYMVIYEKKGTARKDTKTKKQRWVVITVHDTGTGISRDEINKIFLPFYTLKDGGSGLGLALSKKIVKDHGGIIKVKSAAGAGTTFSVYLPLSVTSSN